LTTHYIDEAEHADRVALMLGGRMVALAPPRELRETGLRGTLLEVEAEPPVVALDLLLSLDGVREVTLYGTLLHVLVDDGLDPQRLADTLRQHGLEVRGIREIKPSLEDVFVSRIRGAQAA
jgi:ABC-2 type transport system ATP-binding protein